VSIRRACPPFRLERNRVFAMPCCDFSNRNARASPGAEGADAQAWPGARDLLHMPHGSWIFRDRRALWRPQLRRLRHDGRYGYGAQGHYAESQFGGGAEEDRASLPGGGVSHPRSTGSATSDPRAMRGALAAMIRATASCHPTHGDPARDRRTGWPAPAATRLHRAASAAPTRSSRGHLRGVAAVR